jgi:hypothetical protein
MINIKRFLCHHKYDYIICEDVIANIENDNDDLEDESLYMAIVYCPKCGKIFLKTRIFNNMLSGIDKIREFQRITKKSIKKITVK